MDLARRTRARGINDGITDERHGTEVERKDETQEQRQGQARLLMFLKDWYYPGSDPALSVFTLANPLLPSVPDGGNVLEIGSCDTPFANMVKKANPTLSVTDRKSVV